ncbi:hypothetical protein [Vibrio vulnificus]|uniref:hypothetical protein n=1 Tax=Vibrio vulnificus TaxID=672 RepID=UPI001EECBB2F|nr:hypothetical protein [Vibrio vulnificus]MCG6288877.1 hypothetical protein [Vibrio vulnificus]
MYCKAYVGDISNVIFQSGDLKSRVQKNDSVINYQFTLYQALDQHDADEIDTIPLVISVRGYGW